MPTTDTRRGPRRGATRSPRAGHGRATNRHRYVAAAVVALLVAVAGLTWWGLRAASDWVSGFGTSACRAQAASYSGSRDPEAMANAAVITGIAVKRGLPPRAATIAIATAIQESKLHNISHGDRDSLGLFQQRPSQGWGTAEEIMDPVHAANAFYDALVKVPGWRTGEITKVAQAVQRSGFPEAYAQREPEARAMASNLTGETAAGLGCRLDPLGTGDHRSGPAAVARDLTLDYGVDAARMTASGDTLTVRASTPERAWAAGAWAVAKAQVHGISSVTVGDRTWTRGKASSAWSWQQAASPVTATTVVIR